MRNIIYFIAIVFLSQFGMKGLKAQTGPATAPILFELVYIQLFMKLIGYPLYTYSTVVFAVLLSAGVGSMFSGKLNIGVASRWRIPFIGVISSGAILLLSHNSS